MKPVHQPIYDKNGKQICCTQEEKIYQEANASELLKEEHSDNDGHDDGHDHDHSGDNQTKLQMFLPSIISFSLLIIAILLDYYFKPAWFEGWSRTVWYVIAYLPVALPVLKEAVLAITKGEVFSEFLLMGIATWRFCHWRIS